MTVRGHDPRKNERPPDWRILALAAAHSYEEAAHQLGVSPGTYMRWLAEADPDSRPRVPEADLRATPTSALLRELRRRGEMVEPELTEEDLWARLEEIHPDLLHAVKRRRWSAVALRVQCATALPGGWDPDDLVAWRHEHGWSQQDISDRTGIARATISQWERGVCPPSRPMEVLVGLLMAGEITPSRVADTRPEALETLDRLVAELGLSDRGLARALEFSNRTISTWRGAGSIPGQWRSAALIRWVAELYGLPVSPIDLKEDP